MKCIPRSLKTSNGWWYVYRFDGWYPKFQQTRSTVHKRPWCKIAFSMMQCSLKHVIPLSERNCLWFRIVRAKFHWGNSVKLATNGIACLFLPATKVSSHLLCIIIIIIIIINIIFLLHHVGHAGPMGTIRGHLFFLRGAQFDFRSLWSWDINPWGFKGKTPLSRPCVDSIVRGNHYYLSRELPGPLS